MFTCAKDNSPQVWYTSNGERLGSFEGHQGAINECDVSCTFSLCVSSSPFLWMSSYQPALASDLVHPCFHSPTCMFSPFHLNLSPLIHIFIYSVDSKKLLTGSGDMTMRLWDVVSLSLFLFQCLCSFNFFSSIGNDVHRNLNTRWTTDRPIIRHVDSVTFPI